MTDPESKTPFQEKVGLEVKKVSAQPGDLVVVCAETASDEDIESLSGLLSDMPFRTIVCNFPVRLEKVDARGVLKVVVKGPGDLFAEEDVKEVAATIKQTLESPLEKGGEGGRGQGQQARGRPDIPGQAEDGNRPPHAAG